MEPGNGTVAVACLAEIESGTLLFARGRMG